MYILAYEIANFKYSAAILKFSVTDHVTEIIAFQEMTDSQNNVAEFVPFVDHMLSQSQIHYQNIDYVALTTGPGSFTGIRMGIAFAHGLRLCTQAQFIGISSFEVAAAAVTCENSNSWPILTVLESRRADKYFQLYDAHLKIIKPGACVWPHAYSDYLIDDTLITGNGRDVMRASQYNTVLSSTAVFNACHVGHRAAVIIQSDKISHYPVKPFYLHAAGSFKTST